MMKIRDKSIRAHPQFVITARKAYPYKSMYNITKELNKLLEDMLYARKR